MQVIAKTKNGFLVEVSNDEMPNLCGFKDGYDTDYKRMEVDVGTEIEGAKFFREINEARRVGGELKETIKQLRSAVTKLEKVAIPNI